MSRQPLKTPKPLVSMLAGHTTQQETCLTIECHDKNFMRVTASLDGAASDKTLFDVRGAAWGTSWSIRRKVYGRPLGSVSPESTGSHLFDFRHHSLNVKNGWVVEAADEGRRLATLVHKDFATRHHSDINATVRTTAGEDVLVTMRQSDDDINMVHLRVSGELFATIEKTETNKPDLTLVGSLVVPRTDGSEPCHVWKVRTAAGVDLSLVMIMVLSRAEMAHIWGK